MHSLLPFQLALLNDVLRALSSGRKHILVVMPPGTGRLKIVELIVEHLRQQGCPILIIALTKSVLALAEQRISSVFGDLKAENISFTTLSRLVKEPAASQNTIVTSEHVAISLESTMVVNNSESRSFQALEGVRTLIAFTDQPQQADNAVYGEPVHTLDLSELVAGGYYTAPEFHPLPDYFSGKQPAPEQTGLAANTITKILAGERAVFICDKSQQIEEIGALLGHAAPHIAVQVHSTRLENVDYGETHLPTWVVISSRMVNVTDIGEFRHVVLCQRFRDANQLLAAVAKAFPMGAGQNVRHIWDMGGNARIWESTGFPVGESPDLGENLNKELEQLEAIGPAFQRWFRPLSDGAASHDLMQRDRLVHALRGVIKSKASDWSLAIGLFGQWGSGKSTVLSLLRARMSRLDAVEFIQFNAWENEHVTSIPAALADSITQQVYANRGWLARAALLLKHRLFIKRDIQLSLTLTVLAACLVTVLPFKPLDSALAFMPFALPDAATRIWITMALSVAVGMQLVWKHPITEGITSFLKGINYTEHIGLNRRLRDELKCLFQACRWRPRDMLPNWLKKKWPVSGKERTYIIVVDDLDRCTKESVWSVIEATRLIAEFHEVVLIFAVDYRVLYNALVHRLQGSTKDESAQAQASREFLAKILQLSIQLPRPTSAAVSQYIVKGLFDTTLPALVPGDLTIPQNESPAPDSPSPVTERDASDEIDDVGEDPTSHENYEPSDDLVAGTPEQAMVFNACAMAFGFNNPRTLLRLYNSTILTKALHPEIGENLDEYIRHVLMVFVIEYASQKGRSVSDLDSFFAACEKDSGDTRIHLIRRFANRHGLFQNQALNSLAFRRAECTSLPLLGHLAPEKKQDMA